MDLNLEQANLDLKDQVAKDLEKYLAKYRSQKSGLRLFAQSSGLNERTLNRLLAKKNKPTYQSLLKIYGEIFKTTNQKKIISLAPKIVSEEIQGKCPTPLTSDANFHKEIESELFYDKVFAEIYLLASSAPITLELIQFRFGFNGLETIERMQELKVLKETVNGHFVLADNEIALSPRTIKKLSSLLIDKFAKTNNAQTKGKNLIAFYTEGLSESAYQRWLAIDEKAFYEKLNILKEDGSKGSIRAFTSMVTDTMERN